MPSAISGFVSSLKRRLSPSKSPSSAPQAKTSEVRPNPAQPNAPSHAAKNTMSASQLQLTKQGGPFQVVSVEKPSPDENEVVIRAKAVGLNPLDWKQRDFGIMIEHWPALLGVDASGVIESVGSGVKGFKAGDEVYSLVGMSPKAAGFQNYITVPQSQVALKPAAVSFEEAASLPVCYLTAAMCITGGLHVPLPHLDPEGAGSSSLKSILVVGASGAVGASAVQLLRLALPNATIITTSSAAHHARLQSFGANTTLDRGAQNNPDALRASTPDGAGVDAVLDAVAVAGKEPGIWEAFNPSGPKIYSYPMAGPPIKVPEGIKGGPIFGRAVFGTKGGFRAMPALTELMEAGKFKVPTKVETVGEGLESIAPGLDKLKAGLSGGKYVVTV